MRAEKNARFFPLFLGATLGILLEIISTMIDEIIVSNGFAFFYPAILARIGINAGLSWVLGSQMGVMGIGLASLISLLAALLIKLAFLLAKKHGLKFRLHFSPRDALEIAKLGFSESALSLYLVLLEMMVNGFTLDRYDVAGVAAVSVFIIIFEFTVYLSEGISEYETVAVNDSIGRNSSQSMDHAIRITLRTAVIEGAVIMGLILLISRALTAAFYLDNEETIRLASVMLMILSPAVFFIFLTRVAAVFYKYTRRLKRTLILFFTAIALFPILFSRLLGGIAPEGIAAGISLGLVTAFAVMYLYVRFAKKEKLFDYALMRLS